MNIIILKWVLTNLTLLEVAQPNVTHTTAEMLQSDWAATIVAAKTNPDIGLKPYLPSGTVGLRPTSAAPLYHALGRTLHVMLLHTYLCCILTSDIKGNTVPIPAIWHSSDGELCPEEAGHVSSVVINSPINTLKTEPFRSS